MVSLRSALSILFVLVALSILFFIPSETTGFVTQVKSKERVMVGYVFAFLAVFVLVVKITEKSIKPPE